MSITDVLIGPWGSSAAVSIMGAFLVYFVKRSLNRYDKHIENQYRKIGNIVREDLKKHDELKDVINQIRVDLSVVSTQVEGLGKLIDKINTQGCSWCRNKQKD